VKYLLDTNICIYTINGKSDKIVKKLITCQPGDVAVSSVTIAELRYRAAKSQAFERNNQALDEFLTPLDILDFDNQAAFSYGIIRSNLEKIGKPIGPLDTLIAAQALATQLILVTNNSSEFSRVKGLVVENWL